MPSEPMHRHNGGPLNDEDARKLWDHVRALEILDEQAQDIRDDRKVRKELAKADGFDNNIVEAIIKRRKLGLGESRAADTMVKLYEEALEDEGVLPLEQTRITQPRRRTLEEIAEETHGEKLGDAAPPGREEDQESTESREEAMARAMRDFRERYPEVSMQIASGGGGTLDAMQAAFDAAAPEPAKEPAPTVTPSGDPIPPF